MDLVHHDGKVHRIAAVGIHSAGIVAGHTVIDRNAIAAVKPQSLVAFAAGGVGDDAAGGRSCIGIAGNKIIGGVGDIVAHLHGDAMGQGRLVGDGDTCTGSVTSLKLIDNL